MKIGFTGTQHGMTHKQSAEVFQWLLRLANKGIGPTSEFHHGGCIGADAQAHDLAAGKLPGLYVPHVHWALDMGDGKVAALRFLNDATVYDPKPPLDRNADIVDAAELLIAAPRQRAEVQRSGTWQTIRYARRIGLTTLMVWP